MSLTFRVEGRPQTAGSKTVIPPKGNRKKALVVESGDRTAKKVWREDVRSAAREAIGDEEGWPFDGPCAVEFVFSRRRPATHYGSQRGVPYVKLSAPQFPITRPDLLKVARSIEDALTGILWHDDAAIVDEHLRKVWGDAEGVVVTVHKLGVYREPSQLDALPLAG